jgi:4-hydroxy-tetrahydrodipicolinate synthase
MHEHIFDKVMTAIVTPFSKSKIDFASLEKLINHQINAGIKTIIVAGSTGEVTSLDNHEYHDLLSASVKQNKSLNVIAGCNSSSTDKAINIAKQAQKLGVRALMITMPSYNKPTQEGIYRHFKSIHDATELPIMLYSVPSRTGVDFTDETIIRLSELERIVAFKDAGADIERPLRITAAIGDKIQLFCGDDSIALGFNAHGGCGVVSVASNLIPKEILDVQNSWFNNDFNKALLLQTKLLPLYNALFIETNPIAVKHALSVLGLCSNEIRLPLCELKAANQLLVENIVKTFYMAKQL